MKLYAGMTAAFMLLALIMTSSGDLSGRLGIDLWPNIQPTEREATPPQLWLDLPCTKKCECGA